MSDDRKRQTIKRRITHLEALAASTTFPAEAENCRVKAAELRAKLNVFRPSKVSAWRPSERAPARARKPRKDGQASAFYRDGVIVEPARKRRRRGSKPADAEEQVIDYGPIRNESDEPTNAADVFATFDVGDRPLTTGEEEQKLRRRKFTPLNPAKPKTLDLQFASDGHARGNRGRQLSFGKTAAVKPVSLGVVDSVFEGGFATTADDFVTKLAGRPRIYLTNAENQAAYRQRKLLKSLETQS